jgi:hypothetical protein
MKRFRAFTVWLLGSAGTALLVFSIILMPNHAIADDGDPYVLPPGMCDFGCGLTFPTCTYSTGCCNARAGCATYIACKANAPVGATACECSQYP